LKDHAAVVGVLRIDNTQQGPGTMSTEIHTNLVEEIHLLNAHVTFNQGVTSMLVTATNSIVDQNASAGITNLFVTGQTWHQNGRLSVCNLTAENVTMNQSTNLTTKTLDVTGGVWNQNGVVMVPTVQMNGGTWHQNTNLVVEAIVADGATWNQQVVLSLSDLRLMGGTFTANRNLNVTNIFDLGADVNLIQNNQLSTPDGNLSVDNWIYTLNASQNWNQVSVINTGLVNHGQNITGLCMTASSIFVDSNSTMDVTGRGPGRFGHRRFRGQLWRAWGQRSGLGQSDLWQPDPTHRPWQRWRQLFRRRADQTVHRHLHPRWSTPCQRNATRESQRWRKRGLGLAGC
ncbi:MAG: hypothetical protein AAF492_25810, partial [Verrucomicrobiota bacterium]